jgi:hypothetical protein
MTTNESGLVAAEPQPQIGTPRITWSVSTATLMGGATPDRRAKGHENAGILAMATAYWLLKMVPDSVQVSLDLRINKKSISPNELMQGSIEAEEIYGAKLPRMILAVLRRTNIHKLPEGKGYFGGDLWNDFIIPCAKGHGYGVQLATVHFVNRESRKVVGTANTPVFVSHDGVVQFLNAMGIRIAAARANRR